MALPPPKVLLALPLLLLQLTSVRGEVPSFLSDSPPANFEGSGRAVDNTSPSPLAYDETARYSGSALLGLTSNTAGGCKAQCEVQCKADGKTIGTDLVGFSWYDDRVLADGTENTSPSGDGNYCVCYMVDGNSQTANVGGFEGGTSYGSAVAGTSAGERYGWGYCYGCVTVQPSGQPSSMPSESPSVSAQPSSIPSESPSISTEPSSIPSEHPR